MAETFYGPWSVVVLGDTADRTFVYPILAVEGNVRRFIVAGSDASDGMYAGVPGNTLVTVSGQAWTIAVEHRVPTLPTWWPTEVRRSATYTTQGGLMVYL